MLSIRTNKDPNTKANNIKITNPDPTEDFSVKESLKSSSFLVEYSLRSSIITIYVRKLQKKGTSDKFLLIF